EPAAVEDQRGSVRVGVEVVYTQQDDVVVAGGDLPLDAAVQPRAGTVEQHAATIRGAPYEVGEPVGTPGRQLAARLFLMLGQHADAEMPNAAQLRPRARR